MFCFNTCIKELNWDLISVLLQNTLQLVLNSGFMELWEKVPKTAKGWNFKSLNGIKYMPRCNFGQHQLFVIYHRKIKGIAEPKQGNWDKLAHISEFDWGPIVLQWTKGLISHWSSDVQMSYAGDWSSKRI